MRTKIISEIKNKFYGPWIYINRHSQYWNGYYINKKGTCTIWQYSTDKKPSTEITFVYNGIRYQRNYSNVLSEAGLKSVCSRLISDVLAGHFNSLQ